MSPIISCEIYSNIISLNCLEFFCLFIHLCYHSGLFPHNYESRLLIIALAEFNVLFNPFDECLYFFNYFLISNIYIYSFLTCFFQIICVCVIFCFYCILSILTVFCSIPLQVLCFPLLL